MYAYVKCTMTKQPPTSSILTLLSTLSNPNPTNHARHTQALQARDAALASEQYSNLCLEFARLLSCVSPDGEIIYYVLMIQLYDNDWLIS